MAINKARTSTPMKVLIIALAVIMALFILLPTITSFFNQPRVNSSAQTGTTTATADQLAQQYQGTIQANDAALVKSPKDFTILVNQGNTYFDWAQKTAQASGQADPTMSAALWKKAAGYYERAIATTKTVDPQVTADLAVTYYYGGEVNKAIVTIQKVLKVSPDLPQAVLNSGIFYESAAQTATAVAAYNKYLTLKGVSTDSVTFVKGRLAEIQK